MPLDRRRFLAQFLKGAGCFAVAAGSPFAPRLLFQGASRSPRVHFPQGLASGDPLPDAVVLWTRAEALDGDRAPIPLTLQVSRRPDFARVVVERHVTATAASDHTVRVLVTGLEPDTTYYYRFAAGEDVTDLTGRTRTAPAPDQDTEIRFAFASCQAYEAGFYGAYRRLVNEDEAAPEDERLHFVLHLGDFIYEALGYGGARRVPPFPDGRRIGGDGAPYAVTLADYRHLYKTYLADPDLRLARARFPFVCVWDDHEFSDDAWQGASTYRDGAEPAQDRKAAANQAWTEFIPALLTEHPGSAGIPSEAHDFRPVDVRPAPFQGIGPDGLDREPNNRAAVGSLTIYRSFRWGRHLELVLSDLRSYRTPHPVPPELNRQLAGTDRYLTPLRAVEVFDAGRAYPGGAPATVRVGDAEIPNLRRDAEPGTLLGPRQKTWWKATMAATDATWRVWGHSVPSMPMRLDLGEVDPRAETVVFTTDTWDGYLTERAELMAFLAEHGIANVVSLAGDNHNSFAGLMYRTYGADEPAVGAEFSVCGISSTSVFQALADLVVREGHPLAPIVALPHPEYAESDGLVRALNLTFLHGTRASVTAAATGSLEAGLAAANPEQNPHLRYVDTDAYGYGVVRVGPERVRVTFVVVERPLVDRGVQGARLRRRVHLEVPAWRPGEGARLDGPVVEGEPPFPLRV